MHGVLGIPEYVFLLAVYHVAFFWKFYATWRHSTSEVASNYYPQWLWQGRHPLSISDNIYYLHPACIPFLSMFYFPSKLLAYLAHRLPKDISFRIYSMNVLGHYFLGSLIAFWTLSHWFSLPVALFGALSLVYNAYNIKPQTPCQAFTSCWLMGILLPWPWGAVCFGMSILGGYWPILLTALPITLLNPSCLWGVLLGLPQIIPFLWYFPKSCRAKSLPDPSWGRMPIKRFFVQLRTAENGIIYPEYMFGIGICIVLAWFSANYIWLLFAIIGILGSLGFINIARIPARWLYLTSYSLIFASLYAITGTLWAWVGVGVQSILLWKNRDIYPHFPFSQWWQKPSKLDYSNKTWPGNTGYMNEVGHQVYYGGFSLAEHHRA